MSIASLSRHRAELMGLAILWIMLYHADVVLPGPLHPLMFLKFTGYGAVDLFFLVSGFGLACGWSRRPPTFGPFVRRRLRRVAPVYLVVATAWAVLALAPRGQLDVVSFFELLTGANFLVRRDTVFWFAPSILMAYAAFPAIYALAAHERPLRSATAVALLSVAFLALSVVLARLGAGEYLLLTERLPEFVLGTALGAWLSRAPDAAWPKAPVLVMLALGAATLVGVMRWVPDDARFSLGLRFYPFLLLTLPLGLTTASLLDALAARDGRAWSFPRLRRALAFCGAHSLELYLGHVLIFELAPLGPDGRWTLPPAWNPGRVPEYASYALAAFVLAPALRRLASEPSPRSSSAA